MRSRSWCARSHRVCLGAGKLEEDLIFPSEQFQRLVLNGLDSHDEKDRFYTRFIDDNLAAFLGTREQAEPSWTKLGSALA